MAALLGLLAVVAGGCARSAAEPGPSGVFDVGGGRKLFLDCQGQGSPTVFIVPGKGSYAEAWNVVVPLDDPIRSSPYDIIAQAKFVPSPDAVQPTVAKTTQVCAYDRPNTRPDGADRSTDVPQPHSVQQDVDDVVTLINASAAAHAFGVRRPLLWRLGARFARAYTSGVGCGPGDGRSDVGIPACTGHARTERRV